jgi:predicted nuclease of predicted toxin-antitoxin system
MRFLADMGVDVRVVEWLRQQAHDAKHLRDEGLHRGPDDEIFATAVAEERVVLAFDLDFGEIAALTKGRKASVILFIPEEIRRRLGLKAGAQFVVVCEGDVVG